MAAPLIGLVCFVFYIHRHAYRLRGSLVPDTLIGLAPLFVIACTQWLMRKWKWPLWARVFVGGVVAGLAVGVFYYYALFPVLGTGPDSPEGNANEMVIHYGEAENFGIVGAFVAIVSTLMTHGLARPAGKVEIPSFPLLRGKNKGL